MKKCIIILAFLGYYISIFAFSKTDNLRISNGAIDYFKNSSNYSPGGVTTINLFYKQFTFKETNLLSDSDIISLLKMKDEEKLAHDVYVSFYKKWGGMPFSNIPLAEQNHLNAIIGLLKSHGSADTLIGDPGKFINPKMQKLYDDLIIKGLESIEQAYEVGAWIEDLDIHDLAEAITKISDTNIKMVLENLKRGSQNHLRAFNRQLKNLGVDYKPQFISQSEFNQIVSSSVEKGGQCKTCCKKKGNGKCYRKGSGNCICRAYFCFLKKETVF
jgi:hypothetical protein